MKVALWLGEASSSYSISSKSITALRLGYNGDREPPKACVELHVNRSSPQLACNHAMSMCAGYAPLARSEPCMVMSCPQIRSKEAKSKEDLKTLKISKAFVVNLNIVRLGRGRYRTYLIWV